MVHNHYDIPENELVDKLAKQGSAKRYRKIQSRKI